MPNVPLTQDSATGTLFLNDHTNYEDLRFPATGINPPGLVSDPDIDTNDGTLLFDKASTEIIMGIAQMPHSWKPGLIEPHIHWQGTDDEAGGVLWRFEYDVADRNSAFSGSWTTIDLVAATHEDENINIVSDFVPQINLEQYGLSCVIKWRVSRIGGDVLDTYDADAKLLEFDIHYQIESIGSGEEYSK